MIKANATNVYFENLVLKSFGFHLVTEITKAGFQYMMFVEKLARENPKAFPSTLSQAVLSHQLFVKRGSAA